MLSCVNLGSVPPGSVKSVRLETNFPDETSKIKSWRGISLGASLPYRWPIAGMGLVRVAGRLEYRTRTNHTRMRQDLDKIKTQLRELADAITTAERLEKECARLTREFLKQRSPMKKFLKTKTDWIRHLTTCPPTWPDEAEAGPARFPCVVVTYVKRGGHGEGDASAHVFVYPEDFETPQTLKNLLDLVRHLHDAGTDGNGWQSAALQKAITDADNALWLTDPT